MDGYHQEDIKDNKDIKNIVNPKDVKDVKLIETKPHEDVVVKLDKKGTYKFKHRKILQETFDTLIDMMYTRLKDIYDNESFGATEMWITRENPPTKSGTTIIPVNLIYQEDDKGVIYFWHELDINDFKLRIFLALAKVSEKIIWINPTLRASRFIKLEQSNYDIDPGFLEAHQQLMERLENSKLIYPSYFINGSQTDDDIDPYLPRPYVLPEEEKHDPYKIRQENMKLISLQHDTIAKKPRGRKRKLPIFGPTRSITGAPLIQTYIDSYFKPVKRDSCLNMTHNV